jgi:hypothetical protein
MAKARVKVTIDNAAVIRVVGPQVDKAAYRAGQVTRTRAVANINALGRVATGQMKNTIRVRREETGSSLVRAYTVASTAPYTQFQEAGTRPHGPRRRKFLAFQVRGRGPWVFAKWVRGVTPGRFMYRALKALRVRDYT